MLPAYSVIFFTVSSGAGYGLLFWLSLVRGLGALPDHRWMGTLSLTFALGLITAGLLSSLLHLGHPERAWRAFARWRTSWLSREGVAAIATYLPAGVLWLRWAFFANPADPLVLPILSAAGAVVTVYCTGMIYASLRTIRQWNMVLVPIVYLILGGATGGLLLALMFAMFTRAIPVWLYGSVLASLAAAGILKLWYWKIVDGNSGAHSIADAIGWKGGGAIRQLDPPHTLANFVMQEMGFAVARRYVKGLRYGVGITLVLLPAMLLSGAMVAFPRAFMLLAVASVACGTIIERWLFFAEAEHVSQLYYGRKRA